MTTYQGSANAEIDALRAENEQLRAALEAAMKNRELCPKCQEFAPFTVLLDGKAIYHGLEISHKDDCIIGIALGLFTNNLKGES